MKKKLSLLLILACILSLCAGSALAEIKESEIEDRVYDLIEEHTEYTRDQLRTGQIIWATNTHCWAMSAFLIDCPEDMEGLFSVNLDKEGNLLGEMRVPHKISVQVQLAYQLSACFNNEDCYLRLAEWKAKWSARSDELSLDDMHPFDRSMFELGITKPAEGSIPYEEAYQNAQTYLAQIPNWNESISALYYLHISCYHTPADIGKPVYFFKFHVEYDDSDALTSHFGEHYPAEVSLMVGAQDGSLVEIPIQDLVPTQFRHFDTLIRTEEVLEYVRNNTP